MSNADGYYYDSDDSGEERARDKEEARPVITVAHVCGGSLASRCPVDGGEHDMTALVRFKNGGSVACAKCGVTAMDLDLLGSA